MDWKTRMIRMIAPVLAIGGSVVMSFPSMATTYNDYRACAGRLLGVGVSEQAASQACAEALRPTDLSACVVFIDQRTEIRANDALTTCTRARRPKELATCVVSVSKNTQEAINPDVLNYCGRSLLPVRFAECVVGLRAETKLAPSQALNTCINGSDRVTGFAPTSFSPVQPNTQSNSTFEGQPVPQSPGI
ncbi:hypothetical protein ACQFX9_10350 [Aliinostoc sp. HNIBRCY26]|uniref:hypothetical protein n=1 Tax=Aliinostoc sp. HNIBRCY26 TaxID=3418997 RepID=UPI003D061942